ncbi:MAG: nucleotide sugar dehydrogenase [Alphaproteobacteria bacterium]|jgi:UDP-N-acetyl-D-glucosamine dehydrogenase|nr:nucleotide sugar dehydrogenase [Alphaproteobacteria bacterium]MBU0803933.1 nucleotide sugar dehydrogenase [Alphaproteobacteria bacterium]MBU0872770.1 nucleotide sugar dehydrogenase [Alphaproteobacteria bacterium]MBU1402860.1 nucleotide sugar dehydrogenase [Alphaproteobacteria bacterium]MBU1593502.1 nucleotide sugar dehydrogenase [Alphaproteobacteria bacterium]
MLVAEHARAASLFSKLETRTATVGIVGMGYVGLPLASAVARAGFNVIGFDIDRSKVEKLNGGKSYIDAVSDAALQSHMAEKLFRASCDFAQFEECDVIAICVPTPLTKQREPDLSFVEKTTRSIAQHLRKEQLVLLESTTYPGTTDELMKPILEATGLRSGRDFFLGYSPEREDPGSAGFETATIPKVVAGDGPVASKLVAQFYGSIVEKVVPVSSIKVAEVVKLTENIFRAVNIALVNELKVIYDAMGIDIWEVIEAAKTKPFGYMPFYPGPGLGGHCIPIDPFYLTWKSREFEVSTRFIELSGEINVAMPHYVVSKLIDALDTRLGLPLSQSSILIVGVAYKKNVSDVRESPALKLIELLENRAADIAYHDPHVARIPKTRKHPTLAGKDCIRLSRDSIAAYDAVVIVTDHDDIDYALLANHSRLIIDTRNAMQRANIICDRVVKA